MTQVDKFMDNVFTTLVDKFPNATIRYQHKELSDTHFFKVTPLSIYNAEEFINLNLELNDNFYFSGLEGTLCFITKDSLTEVNSPRRIHNPIDMNQVLNSPVGLVAEYKSGATNSIVKNNNTIRFMNFSSFSKITFNTESEKLNDTTKLAA
jgi:hypothetical protein